MEGARVGLGTGGNVGVDEILLRMQSMNLRDESTTDDQDRLTSNDSNTKMKDMFKHRCTVFLVPTVPLVSQQANYIKSNSNLRTSQIWGGMRNQSASRILKKDVWQKEIQEADVIVMTADIFRISLDEATIDLSMVVHL